MLTKSDPKEIENFSIRVRNRFDFLQRKKYFIFMIRFSWRYVKGPKYTHIKTGCTKNAYRFVGAFKTLINCTITAMGRPFLLRDAIYEPIRKLNLYFYTLCARRTCLVYFFTYISLSISISASLYLCFSLSLSLSLSFSLSSDMHYFHGQNRFLLLNYSYQM